MNTHRFLTLATILLASLAGFVDAQAASTKEVHFYSEGVLCYGKVYLPDAHSESSKLPAVILAPGARQTSASLEKYASEFAARGVVAMTFDYRGWGKSGGLLYFGEPVRWDDRLRFSQTTTKMLIRRKRLEPQLQLIDIRNAITYLQGEVGVDRARIGLWGMDLSGGHAVVVAGFDARVKAIVAQNPSLEGKDIPRKAFAPTAEQQAAMIRLARTGTAPATVQTATAMNAEESKLAFAEYYPFWYVDQIPQSTAARFVLAATNADATTEANVNAATKILKGTTDIVKSPNVDAAASAAAEWFAKNL
jgi:dienelactone hydrolase